jgi:hypothetical protein
MSQFNAPVRRSGGGLDVYTGLLLVATVVLIAGIAWVVKVNIEHSADGGSGGGPFKIVSS